MFWLEGLGLFRALISSPSPLSVFKKCKKIAQSTDDVIVNKPHVSDEEEEERPFYNHPFKLSEPKPIFFNLSVSIPLIFNI